jgi:hypothetical protein
LRFRLDETGRFDQCRIVTGVTNATPWHPQNIRGRVGGICDCVMYKSFETGKLTSISYFIDFE